MAHRRRKHRRRHARENPLSDTTKIVLAVGVTAAVVGVGYYLYRRQQGLPMFGSASAPNAPPQLSGQGGVQSQPAPGAPSGGSTQSSAGSSATSNANLTPKTSTQAPYTAVAVMATRAVAAPAAPTSIHAPKYIPGMPVVSKPPPPGGIDPNAPYGP